MKITKLEKEANINSNTCKITLEITLDCSDFAEFDYTGIDKVPDDSIYDILIEAAKKARKKISDYRTK